MRADRRNQSGIVRIDSTISLCAPIAARATAVLLGIVLIALPANAQPEVLPQPRLQGQPFVDPNHSENVIPKPPEVDAPPPEQETDVAQRIKLFRESPLYAGIKDKQLVLGGPEAKDEEIAYNYIFKHAHEFTPEQLAQYSLKGGNDKGLPHVDLVGDTRPDFLRQLVHLEGRLVRIRPMQPTDELAKQFKVLYEGWFLNNNNPEYTVCVVFSELPEGVQTGDGLSYRIAVDGYYFKLLKYKSKEPLPGKKDQFVERLAPLILTRTIRLLDSPDGSAIGADFVPLALTVLVAFGLFVVGLFWWFRREDKQVQKLTQQALGTKNPFDPENPANEANPGWNRINPPPSSN